MNLTPKEKAKELVDKFKYNTRAFNETNGWEDSCYNAKQCALIHIDIMIDSIEVGFEDSKSLAKINYYQEVKTEIEKL
jgi:hypothetical protein